MIKSKPAKKSTKQRVIRIGTGPRLIQQRVASASPAPTPVPSDEPQFRGWASRFLHTDIINAAIEAHGYTSYLEIGCDKDACFSQVRCAEKVGVDPVRGGTLRMTSDNFFAESNAKFDLIFIDGDHHHNQAHRDVENALAALSQGGIIVMHDCSPPARIYEGLGFCGTVWRAFAKCRERIDLDGMVGNFDFGVGVIFPRPNTSPIVTGKTMDQMTYDDLIAHRGDWIRSVNDVDLFAAVREVRVPSKPTIAVLVIGKDEDELEAFRQRSPDSQKEARFVYVANPGKHLGGYAAIANPFLDACTEDVVAVIHADTGFGAGAVTTFAEQCLVRGGRLTGIVGRSTPRGADPWASYLWCNAGGGVVSTLDSCCVFFPRKLGLRFDGATFDDFHCVVEDLCLQARARGIEPIVPAATASHIGGNVSANGKQNWAEDFYRYRAKLVAKWPGYDIHTV